MKAHQSRLRRILVLMVAVSTALISGSPNGLQVAHATPGSACAGLSDVPTHFYACFDLQQLVNIGAVTGYGNNGDTTCTTRNRPSPCFIPEDPINRGQFSKILARTFGWVNPNPGVQHFQDAGPGTTFYNEIEAVRAYDGIGGYSCGGPNEPCVAPGNLPYFRPAATVTRGQMAKFVANAAGMYNNTSGRTPTFLDVPDASSPTPNVFFDYIERLVMNVANGPFPPNVQTPYCAHQVSATTQACFYPSNAAPRIDAAYYISKARTVRDYIQNAGGGVPHQVLPKVGQGSYDHVTAYVSAPNLPGSDKYIAVPVGITDLYNGHFVESGALSGYFRDGNNNYQTGVHPYANWNDGVAGPDHTVWHTEIYLASGQSYTYRTDPTFTGSSQWTAFWCDQNCTPLITSGDLGISNLDYAIAGGETDAYTTNFGTLFIGNAYASRLGYYNPLCNDLTLTPSITYKGSIGSCSYGSYYIYDPQYP